MRTVILAAVILTAFSSGSGAQPSTPSGATLTVQGQGRVQVPPDHASLSVDVVTKGKSAEAATAAHRERASRAAAALREMKTDGVEIEQSNFRLAEMRTPPVPGTQRQPESEYQAVTTFGLKLTQMASVDASVTKIASTGLFQVRQMNFGIDDKNPGMKAARKSAVDDAKERAATYAEAAGVHLDEILRINDSDARVPRDFAVAAPMMRSVQVVPPSTLTLSASVTMTWRIGTKP